MIGIGIDTGGTYTDAVAYDMEAKQILCWGKALTTREKLESGIAKALDQLDQDLLGKAEMLALSTTLATNACVEDKGSRARLLMIGTDPKMLEGLEGVYSSYGFRDLNQISVLEGKVERVYAEPQEPDWESLRARIPEEFADCQSLGIVQMFPHANGARFEQEAKRLLKDILHIPITSASEMFDEIDILKRGAGTLLNARLIPLIDDFLEAVANVMRARHMEIPLAIVRSDGSLMTEEMAKECPVETLLSGPAASVIGGSCLADRREGIIVDMGGTTTDIALIRDRKPVRADKGISIGSWKTMVKGLYIDTFGLGGDSAVRFSKGRMLLEATRVVPISVVGEVYPRILGELKSLAARKKPHTRILYEYYLLQRDIRDLTGYTEKEKAICQALLDGPLLPEALAGRIGGDLYSLHMERLEEEGVLVKCGLTPTDMMVIKGDFTIYKPDCALAAAACLAPNVVEEAEEIPDKVYDMVVKKMYCNIVRILLEQKYPAGKVTNREIESFVEMCYESAVKKEEDWINMQFTTDLPLIGVGAPIHVFLPKVAELLKTEAIIEVNASVANALGAIAGQIITRLQVRVKAEYKGSSLEGFSVFENGEKFLYEELGDALAKAKEIAVAQVREKALRQGGSNKPHIRINVKDIRTETVASGLYFESIVEAVATDAFQFM